MPLLLILILGAIVGVVFLFMGAAWIVAVVAALFAVPSLFLLQPIFLLLSSAGISDDDAHLVVYILPHAALGACLGWWIGKRAIGATGSQPAWPGQDSQRSATGFTPGKHGSGIALPEVPWDVRMLNWLRSVGRRLKAYYRLYPRWALGVGVWSSMILIPLLVLISPLLLIGATVLAALIYRRRRSADPP